jgi:hypothetical protein
MRLLFVAGSRTQAQAVGIVACVCGLCRRITRQQLLAFAHRDHMMFVTVSAGVSAHARTCLECGNTTRADLAEHPSVALDAAAAGAPLPTLAANTYPRAAEVEERFDTLSKRAEAGDRAAKQELLHAALSSVEWEVESFGDASIAHAFAVAAGPLFILGTALVAFVRGLPHVDLITLAMMLFAGALLVLIFKRWILGPRRAVRRRIVPGLARSIAPLRASREELSAALAPFKTKKSSLGLVLRPSDVIG